MAMNEEPQFTIPQRPQYTTEVAMKDPLSDVTRNERKLLLGVSATVVTVVHVGLVPTKITALGIDFNPANQKALVNIAALITFYFLATFIAYAWNDYFAWYHAVCDNWSEWRAYRKHPLCPRIEEDLTGIFSYRPFYARTSWPVVKSMSNFMDYVFPILLGLYAIIAALQYAPSPAKSQNQSAGLGESKTILGPSNLKPSALKAKSD